MTELLERLLMEAVWEWMERTDVRVFDASPHFTLIRRRIQINPPLTHINLTLMV